MENEYQFLDEWDVDAPIEKVYQALADSRTYPDWWKTVYLKVESDGLPEVGRVAWHYFKGKLPYHLKLSSRIVRLEFPMLIETQVRGDLNGRGIWTLRQKGSKVQVTFDWRVLADKPLLRILTPILKPLFRWNHQWAIERAKEGLEEYARKIE